MKIRLLSDIHVEFSPPTPAYDRSVGQDITIFAGDIGVGISGVQWAEKEFDGDKLYLAGNHEFYNKDIGPTTGKIKANCSFAGMDSLLYPGDFLIKDGVLFVGGTFWTDYELYGNKKMAMLAAQKQISDHHIIFDMQSETRRFTPDQALNFHLADLAGIKTQLERHPECEKVVVATHHAPHAKSIHRNYEGDALNPAFASNMEKFILDNPRIKLWVHGHMHNNSDYMIGDCRVVCNPRGYSYHGKNEENPEFNPNMILEV